MGEVGYKTLAIDIETFSDVDLIKCGVYAYADSPAFEILLFAYSFDDEETKIIDEIDFFVDLIVTMYEFERKVSNNG